ncbi:hypothetical protein LCGC14_2972590, partial [marine sediment metagenome]
MSNNIFELEVFKAGYGDSLLVRYGNGSNISNILIDGGIGKTGRDLKKRINRLFNEEQVIDLLIITHIDNDHLLGIKSLFKSSFFNRDNLKLIWFNCSLNLGFELNSHLTEITMDTDESVNHGIKNAIILENLIKDLEIAYSKHPIIEGNDSYTLKEGKITILSPNKGALESLKEDWEDEILKRRDHRAQKDYGHPVEDLLEKAFHEDSSKTNRSSIAIIIEYLSKKILLLGDSVSSIVCDSLSKINSDKRFALVKLSHHGSRKNTSDNLFDYIQSNYFVVSTNGGRFNHPDKECLARIANYYEDEIIFAYN